MVNRAQSAATLVGGPQDQRIAVAGVPVIGSEMVVRRGSRIATEMAGVAAVLAGLGNRSLDVCGDFILNY